MSPDGSVRTLEDEIGIGDGLRLLARPEVRPQVANPELVVFGRHFVRCRQVSVHKNGQKRNLF